MFGVNLDSVVNENKISYFYNIVKILEHLQIIEFPMSQDEVDECVSRIEKLTKLADELIQPKLIFVMHQLQLAFMHIKHHRYSSNLLSTCVTWENTSNLYKQIGLLTLNTLKCLHQQLVLRLG